MLYEKVIDQPEFYNFMIDQLGGSTIPSPVKGRKFVSNAERIAFSSQMLNIQKLIEAGSTFPSFEKAGPREKIFHDPSWSRAAIVTCGGLCPGLNNVIKGLVNVLYYDYGVKNIFGIRYGYQGLNPEHHFSPIILDPKVVDNIHERGGTILGSSRGDQDIGVMLDTLMRMNINMLFCIGGDGTLKGAKAIAEEAGRRHLAISVIGIPKTIDNDLSFIEKTFGFETAVFAAFDIITTAHNEAEGANNGIGLVKLMGRDSGFIAGAASLANSVVDFCLIPESQFELGGEHGLLAALERKLNESNHAVIVVAEGAGQNLFKDNELKHDASGNTLHKDIGIFLKDKIREYFSEKKRDFTVKYFDPSYYIRSTSAQANDAIFCYLLAEHAVHAAMAGKTNTVIGHWNNFFTHVPIQLATMERRKMDLEGALWKGVLSSTRQNDYF